MPPMRLATYLPAVVAVSAVPLDGCPLGRTSLPSGVYALQRRNGCIHSLGGSGGTPTLPRLRRPSPTPKGGGRRGPARNFLLPYRPRRRELDPPAASCGVHRSPHRSPWATVHSPKVPELRPATTVEDKGLEPSPDNTVVPPCPSQPDESPMWTPNPSVVCVLACPTARLRWHVPWSYSGLVGCLQRGGTLTLSHPRGTFSHRSRLSKTIVVAYPHNERTVHSL